MSAVLSLGQKEIYREIRLYLLGLFPGSESQIIQAFQNNSPLPNDAMVMQALFDRNLDETSTYFDQALSKAYAQNSVDVRLQISFFGSDAEARSRTVSTLWKSPYTTDRLVNCQPLYVQGRNRMPYINDSNQYEDRWVVDLSLQYNPSVSYDQDFAEETEINIAPAAE